MLLYNLACHILGTCLSGVLWRLDYGVEIFHEFFASKFWWVRANAGTVQTLSSQQVN